MNALQYLDLYGQYAEWAKLIWGMVGIITGTFIAATIGVLGAQYIIEWSRRKAADLRELRQTNAAITLAISISNTMMAVKKQHVLPMKEAYSGHRRIYAENRAAVQAGQQPPHPYVIEFELSAFQMPILPLAHLQKIVFEDLNIIGRPLTLTAQIQTTAASLHGLLDTRNEQLVTFRRLGDSDKVGFYFGVAGPNIRDLSFVHVFEGIVAHTDDGIFFPNLLVRDLQAHGERIRKRLGRDAPNVTTHVTTPEFEHLNPSDDDYQDWINNFPVRERPKNWWRF
jgi:hypothetical protein